MGVVGIAGHVEHGKSTLLRALAGENRVAALELAWLTLPNGEAADLVELQADTLEGMLAGTPGLDACLLVVGADEGITPQSREYLALLQAMAVPQLALVLTKIDIAENADWLERVEYAALEILLESRFADAPILKVSANTREGLPELGELLAEFIEHKPLRTDHSRPVLAVDGVFNLSGLGTFATGTLLDGALETGQVVELQPAGISARVRGLQVRESSVERAVPGERVAVNLSGVEKSDVTRGNLLSLPDLLKPTFLFDAHLSLRSAIGRSLRHDSVVRVLVGACTGRVRLRLLDGDELPPGAEAYAQMMPVTPLPLRAGDHFVLCALDPLEAVGEGEVLDPMPGRAWERFNQSVLERFEVLAHGDPAQQLAFLLKLHRVPQPLESYDDPGILAEARSRYDLYNIETYVAHPAAITELGEGAAQLLAIFHQENPLLPGIDPAELLRQLGLNEDDTIALTALAEKGVIEYGRLVSLPGQGMHFTKAQTRAVAALLEEFSARPFAPPSYKEALEIVDDKVLKALLAQGELIFLRPDVLLLPTVYGQMVVFARSKLEVGEMLTLADLRDHFDSTRRIVRPFLDHLEGLGITRRTDEGHFLHQPNWDRLFMKP
jgi:selenocysteine-specific elongation factor